MVAALGSRPTMKVDRPIMRMVTRKAVFARGPRCADAPKPMAPKGAPGSRRRKPAARKYRGSLANRPRELRADDAGKRAVEIEIIPFENGTER